MSANFYYFLVAGASPDSGSSSGKSVSEQNADSGHPDSPDDDGLGPLPPNWEKALTDKGEPYFIDHNTGRDEFCSKQGCGSMAFWCGSGSCYFRHNLRDANKKLIFYLKFFFCQLHFEGTFTSFSKIKSQKESQNSRNQGFSYYFCMMIEGSGSGSIPLTSGSGSATGSKVPLSGLCVVRNGNNHMDPDPKLSKKIGELCSFKGTGSPAGLRYF